MEATTVYPGSCGEIIQGKVHGFDILISCPVNLFTSVRVFESKRPVKRYQYEKSSTLIENMLERWGHGDLNSGFDIEIESSIPKGKGFASSTADMCAVYISLLKILSRKYDVLEVMEEFIKIEPTDSIIFRDITMLDYKSGRLYKELGAYLKFYILAFEGEREVDTIDFNKSAIPPLADVSDILPKVQNGIKSNDIPKIAEASTVSINRNKGRVSYDVMGQVEALKDLTGGLGILGAHSGDILGIIYDDREQLEFALKYKDSIKGYKPHALETLRRNEYERDYDYGALKRQRKDNGNTGAY